MKRSFFQAAVTSILLYGCTTWTLTKRLEKKLDGNYTRMLRAILNKSWQQHPTRHQLYGHLPPITKTIQVRRTRHAGHCWRSRDELIRDVLLWIPTHGRAKAGRPARTYIQQLCEDTGCCPEDLPRAMNDREEWRERVRDIRATSTIWWWWWVFSTSSVGTSWVYCWLRRFLFGGLSGSRWSYRWSSIQVSRFSVGIYSFRLQVCRGWRWIVKTKIHVCLLGQGFSSFGIFWSVALSASRCVSIFGPFSSIRNSVSMWVIHSAFLLWSFRSYILLQNLFASFASCCWYTFAHSPPTCW